MLSFNLPDSHTDWALCCKSLLYEGIPLDFLEAAGLKQLFPMSGHKTGNKTLWVLILSSLHTPAWSDCWGENLWA